MALPRVSPARPHVTHATRSALAAALAALLLADCATTEPAPPPPSAVPAASVAAEPTPPPSSAIAPDLAPTTPPTTTTPLTTAPPPTAPPTTVPRILPFDPSPDDLPADGAAGFGGTAKVTLADGSEAVGPRVFGVKKGSGLEDAGVEANDVIVGVGGTVIRPGEADPIGRYRALVGTHAPDTETTFDVWREGKGVRTVTVMLGRRPPAFARIETPAAWFGSDLRNAALDDVIADAVALDGGTARTMDTLERNRKHAAKHDPFRLRQVTEAHMNLTANEPLAILLASAITQDPVAAARLAAAAAPDADGFPAPTLADGTDVAALVESIAPHVAEIDRLARSALAAWSEEDRTWFGENFEKLTERLNQGEYIYEDEVPARERTNRRLVALLAKVDVGRIADAARLARGLVAAAAPRLAVAARAAQKEGLLASKSTPAGAIEVWGGGSQKHMNRCAFLFDLGGNDNYLDVGGRADLTQPVSIYVDDSGDDLWAASSPFGLAAALGGVSVVLDVAGDDQYLSRDWTQGAAVAGFALLEDRGGRDVYHAQDLSQGIGMAGAGVVVDANGDDLFTGARFCQGIGFPRGVGAVVDREGNDRYVCTGRYDSDYGDVGQFSGWGQGVGFGFRWIASGGIGLLLDARGDDVYEAGNFSQGGGYFYAWGILWDAQGKDRYIGSRYAQGFAAHQAVGTFLEGGGDDLYQSHSGVAQGLSWDETSVVFHDMGGNDRYETAGFSLASAAHNGMVLFLDDGGDDVYAGLPAHAGSNEYHGGRSFALFLDRGGNDVYVGADAKEWNDRAAVRDDGAYHLDLPDRPAAVKTYLR